MSAKRDSGITADFTDSEAFRNRVAKEGIHPGTFSQFQKIILSFYNHEGRDMPWRHTTNPYHILVSEIMLQQTQVDRVRKKYPEFITAFPTYASLADAPLHQVLAVWQGMGYNRRAIALQACARKVMEEYNGILPADTEVLKTLPGIGHATACSIAAFAFNKPVVFIETNIRRVFIHFFFNDRSSVHDREILPLAEQALYRKNPRVWYWAMMDYGAALKNAIPNPNRKSAHYTKQETFKGSDRQIRGIVIRALLEVPGQDEQELLKNIPHDPARLYRIIEGLVAEGFITRTGTRLTIRAF
jgi:A/G-specific adenine glycosylase